MEIVLKQVKEKNFSPQILHLVKLSFKIKVQTFLNIQVLRFFLSSITSLKVIFMGVLHEEENDPIWKHKNTGRNMVELCKPKL